MLYPSTPKFHSSNRSSLVSSDADQVSSSETRLPCAYEPPNTKTRYLPAGAYTGAGLSPDGSSSYFLPRIIGQRRSLELMLTNRVLSAAEALDWGLVNQVVAPEELMPTAEKLVGRLASGATNAFGVVMMTRVSRSQ